MAHLTDQVKVENLKKLRRDELEESLIGLEKLLSNQRLLKALPDKGEKIIKYGEQVRLAIQYHDEEDRRQSAAGTKLKSKLHQEPSVSKEAAAAEALEMAAGVAAASEDSDLVDSLKMMSVSDGDTDLWSDRMQTTNNPEEDNYFFKTHEKKKPHCLTVLDKIEHTNPSRKQTFKTNQIPQREEISVQERRVRDRKHLDDVTAATLPPLHHSGAVMLSLEESANLLQEQMRKRRGLEAKMAAQKLSKGLKISIGTYSPDDSPTASYREVHGKEDHDSSDED